jgi:hypothetical protein
VEPLIDRRVRDQNNYSGPILGTMQAYSRQKIPNSDHQGQSRCLKLHSCWLKPAQSGSATAQAARGYAHSGNDWTSSQLELMDLTALVKEFTLRLLHMR